MAMPCVNVSLSWLQRSSRWTALLLLAAMVPNSMLRRCTSITCVAIQYQFGSWKEFVVAARAHVILFLGGFSCWVLFCFLTISGVSVHTIEDPSSRCKLSPNCFGEIFHKHLFFWKGARSPSAENSTFQCALAFYLHRRLRNMTPVGWFWAMTERACHA